MNNFKSPQFIRLLQFHSQVNKHQCSVQNLQKLNNNYNQEKQKMKKMKNIFLQKMKIIQFLIIITAIANKINYNRIKLIMTLHKIKKIRNYLKLNQKKIKIMNKNNMKWKLKIIKKLKTAEIICLNYLVKRKKKKIMKKQKKIKIKLIVLLQIFLKVCILNQIHSNKKKSRWSYKMKALSKFLKTIEHLLLRKIIYNRNFNFFL